MEGPTYDHASTDSTHISINEQHSTAPDDNCLMDLDPPALEQGYESKDQYFGFVLPGKRIYDFCVNKLHFPPLDDGDEDGYTNSFVTYLRDRASFQLYVWATVTTEVDPSEEEAYAGILEEKVMTALAVCTNRSMGTRPTVRQMKKIMMVCEPILGPPRWWTGFSGEVDEEAEVHAASSRS